MLMLLEEKVRNINLIWTHHLEIIMLVQRFMVYLKFMHIAIPRAVLMALLKNGNILSLTLLHVKIFLCH